MTFRPFCGLLAPNGTPAFIIARMQAAISEIIQDPGLRKEWESQGGVPVGSSSSAFAHRLQIESERWSELIRTNNIKIEQ
jgi:tripartite-type tricarboxylate transporter receptor subunit TctC